MGVAVFEGEPQLEGIGRERVDRGPVAHDLDARQRRLAPERQGRPAAGEQRLAREDRSVRSVRRERRLSQVAPLLSLEDES